MFVSNDDILIVTKGTKNEHMVKVWKKLQTLDMANLRTKAEKFKFAQSQIEWLEFKMTNSGVLPVNNKVQGIKERLQPTNLNELRSYLGAVNQFKNFVPD